MPIRVIHPTIIIVLLINSHYSFIHLTHHTLTLFELIYSIVDHNELIFYMTAVNLRVHFLIAKVLVWQATLQPILLPIFLEIYESILHDVQVVHILLVVSAVTLLFFDEFCSFQKVVLYPILGAIQNKRIDHHNKEKFQVGVTFKNTEYIHRKVNQNLCIFKQQPKHKQFSYCEDHQPYQQLDEVYFIVDVSVQLLVGIPVYILRIVQVQVNSALQYDYVVFGGKKCDKMMDE